MRIQQVVWRLCFCGVGVVALGNGGAADEPDSAREFVNRIREQLAESVKPEAGDDKPGTAEPPSGQPSELTERQRQIQRIQQEVEERVREAQERANRQQKQSAEEFRARREESERAFEELRRRLPGETRPVLGPGQKPGAGLKPDHQPHHPPEGRAGVDPRLRIQHLQRAAENLQAAGLTEEADRLRRRADEMQKELERVLPTGEEGQRAILRELQDLRRSVDELRREVQTLRHELKVPQHAGPQHGPGHHPQPPIHGVIVPMHQEGFRPIPLGRPHQPDGPGRPGLAFPGDSDRGDAPVTRGPRGVIRGFDSPSADAPRGSDKLPSSGAIPSSKLDEPVPDPRLVPAEGKDQGKDSKKGDEDKPSDRDEPKKGKPEKAKKDSREKPQPQDD